MFSEIAVLYPKGYQTGGPEALHQLVDSLRRSGHDAYLVPARGTEVNERLDAYSRYDAPERPTISDVAGAAVVIPEVMLLDSPQVRHATVFMWWLSVNGAASATVAVSRLERELGIRGEEMPRLRQRGTALGVWLAKRRRLKQRTEHDTALAQSQYAWSYVYGVTRRPPSMVADYTPAPEALKAAAVPVSKRRRAVCFNPKKSGQLARQVSALMADVEFVPIENMTRQQVTVTLGQCAVYLDLGAHPGKDRLPREAALAGAVVVVAMRGAAAFHADVPIPLQHKVMIDGNAITSARDVVADVLANLEDASAAQDSYRDVIAREREIFDAQVRAVFVHGLRGFDADYPIVEAIERLPFD